MLSVQDDQKIEVQVFQVGNETISDLLVKDLKQIASVDLAKTASVKSTDEGIQIFEEALDNRAVVAAKMGGKRARAHQVITIKVPGANGKEPGCLQLVDLSGSERVGRSDATGDIYFQALLLVMYCYKTNQSECSCDKGNLVINKQCALFMSSLHGGK